MLTSFTSDEAMLDAILAGASGYVVKDIKGMERRTQAAVFISKLDESRRRPEV
jgi:DNA-binding NarL/FixJ family response regulator